MSLWNKALAAGACVAILACSGPDSPLILGSDGKDVALGMRTLTSDQGRALLNAVTSAQEPCDTVERAYLRNVDPGRSESWDVLCRTGVYRVQVFADGTAADVRRCFEWSPDGCVDPNARRRFRQYPDLQVPDRRAQPGQLNPDLGKLLEQMDKEGGKKD
jgi:hypothetical protein